jgi:hypothetical protein
VSDLPNRVGEPLTSLEKKRRETGERRCSSITALNRADRLAAKERT